MGERYRARQKERERERDDVTASYTFLKDFLQESIQTLKKLAPNKAMSRESFSVLSRASSNPRPVKVLVVGSSECPLCHQGHSIRRCKEFETMAVAQRRIFANRARLCYNCLESGHTTQNCSSDYRCRWCSRQHHTLLHQPENSKRTSTSPLKTQQQASVNDKTTRRANRKSLRHDYLCSLPQ